MKYVMGALIAGLIVFSCTGCTSQAVVVSNPRPLTVEQARAVFPDYTFLYFREFEPAPVYREWHRELCECMDTMKDNFDMIYWYSASRILYNTGAQGQILATHRVVPMGVIDRPGIVVYGSVIVLTLEVLSHDVSFQKRVAQHEMQHRLLPYGKHRSRLFRECKVTIVQTPMRQW
jgi:hypothetical protein